LINLKNPYKSIKKILVKKTPTIFKSDLDRVIVKDNNNILWPFTKSKNIVEEFRLYMQQQEIMLFHLNKLVGNGCNFIEIGAGFGFFSVALAKQNNISNFYPIETEQEFYNQLIETIKINHLENVFPLSYFSFQKNDSSVFKNFCETNGIDQVDVLKLSLDGKELDFILGVKDLLNYTDQLILVMDFNETNCNAYNYSASELYDYICQFGFAGFVPQGKFFGLKKLSHFPDNFKGSIFFKKVD
jgi:hypothetical protein